MTPPIRITRIQQQEEAAVALLARGSQNLRDIRRRAFDFFQQRGQRSGNDWDDWLRAERELLWKPSAEMFENPRAVVLRVAVPGFDPKSIQVTATPAWLSIEGTEEHCHTGMEARLRFCEFGRRLFRRFDMPARVDPATVGATLEKGILEIVAGKVRPARAGQNGIAASSSNQTGTRVCNS